MKTRKIGITILLFLLVYFINENKKIIVGENMNKVVQTEKEKKYITYEEFNKKYSYYDTRNIFLNQSDSEVISKYISEKEKKLEKISDSKGMLQMRKILKNFSTDEEKIIQMIKIMTGAKKEENETMEILNNYIISSFGDELREGGMGILKNFDLIDNDEKYYLNLLENNFTEEEIRLFFDIYYYNPEFEIYDIEGYYGLKKVDKVISEVEKIKGITDEERSRREMSLYIPTFKNEYKEYYENIYVLKDNRIIITKNKNRPQKEIKIKDYKKVDISMYKGILYIYDDNKIYEYSLDNLEIIKIIDLEKENII